MQPVEMECLEVRDPVDSHYIGDAQQIVLTMAGYDRKTVWSKDYGSAKGIFQNIDANRFRLDEWFNPVMIRVSNGDDVYYEFDASPDKPDKPGGINTAAVADAGVSIEGRTLKATAPMSVFTIDGRTVAAGVTEATVTTAGVYIVSSGTTRTKIAVR